MQNPHNSERDKIRVHTLYYDAGFSESYIAQITNIPYATVCQFIATGDVLPPIKSSGRRRTLTEVEVDRIVAYITSSSEGRRASWEKLANVVFPELQVHYSTIRRALHARGYHRHIALRKPPLRERNKENRTSRTP